MSKIPGDNGSSLNKLITLKIIALGVVSLIVYADIQIYNWDGQTSGPRTDGDASV
jgi:hypothetical protein